MRDYVPDVAIQSKLVNVVNQPLAAPDWFSKLRGVDTFAFLLEASKEVVEKRVLPLIKDFLTLQLPASSKAIDASSSQ